MCVCDSGADVSGAAQILINNGKNWTDGTAILSIYAPSSHPPLMAELFCQRRIKRGDTRDICLCAALLVLGQCGHNTAL